MLHSLLVFNLRGNELVTLTVDVNNLDLWIVLEVLTQLGDVNIHRACVEVVIVDPDGLQSEVALQNLVRVAAEQGQQLVLLCGELGLLLAYLEQLLLGVECELTQAVNCRLAALLALGTAQNGLNTEYELLH